MTRISRPEDGHGMVTRFEKESIFGYDMVTGATEQIRNRHDMVTGATEQIRSRHDMVTRVQKDSPCGHDMVTGVQAEVTYSSPSTSSGKQQKNRFTSHRQFRREKTPATIEADQIFLAFQQLAKNNLSANFLININTIFKLPKSLKITMPSFDGKSEKF